MQSAFVILGGIGVFLYGLRIMSSGLQKVAGDRLRSILAGMTRNRFSGVLSGFFITSAIQSSSATTVLVVSFANAGLLTLTQCLGLIMGANIGTTVTGWLVALLGFKVKIAAFALPVIGLGFPLSFVNRPMARQLSEVMIGFGLLFLGLQFLKDGIPTANPDALDWLQALTGYGFGSVLLFVLIGTILTIILQSSSATMALTLTMAAKGWIGYELAAAMVLGENLGTTITATLASLGANRNAKRAARFHTIFNVLGVLWVLPLMPMILPAIESTIGGSTATNLAAFHTIFNVTNTFVLVWFTPQMERLVMRMVPLSEFEEENTHLTYLETSLLGTPELALSEVKRALREMVEVCQKAFTRAGEVLSKPGEKLGEVVEEVKKLESQTDDMEEEVVAFCAQLARVGSSQRVGQDVALFLELANDIERMGDHCANLVVLAQKRFDKGLAVNEPTQQQLIEMIALVQEMFTKTKECFGPQGVENLADIKPIEKTINKMRNKGRKRHTKRIQAGELAVREGLLFIDMMTNMEKIGDYCWNVCKAMSDAQQAR